jgi:phenylalanine-4-hydroxylase
MSSASWVCSALWADLIGGCCARVVSAPWDALEHLGRLYWYTVEFGLIAEPEGLRIYGAGIG